MLRKWPHISVCVTATYIYIRGQNAFAFFDAHTSTHQYTHTPDTARIASWTGANNARPMRPTIPLPGPRWKGRLVILNQYLTRY